ncbi:hypothetical protein [Streptomyces sp. NPDC048623]
MTLVTTYGTYEEFVRLATADPAVVGLALKGSQTHEGTPPRPR